MRCVYILLNIFVDFPNKKVSFSCFIDGNLLQIAIALPKNPKIFPKL
jgi:hypothetical protein